MPDRIPQVAGDSVNLALPPRITKAEELATLLNKDLPDLAWLVADYLDAHAATQDPKGEPDLGTAVAMLCDLATWSQAAGQALTAGVWGQPDGTDDPDAVARLERVGEAMKAAPLEFGVVTFDALAEIIARASARSGGEERTTGPA